MTGVAPTVTHPWVRGALTQEPFLIVAGGYRCGTTSLYGCLADHPQVNPSTIKEPAFFFSQRLREQPSAYPAGREADAYLSLFRKRGAPVRLEATSNYLEDPGCAQRIKAVLPNARVIILLREPVARLVSWYRFLRLQGMLEASVGFDAWAGAQLDDARPVHERPYLEQAVAHGRYAEHVGEFLRVLGRDRVHVIWFDAFKRDPLATMRAVCRFAGLAPEFYENYAVTHQNEAVKIGRPRLFRAYRALHRPLLAALGFAPMLQFRAREWFYGVLEPRLLPFFTAPADPVTVPEALRARLRACYRPDLDALRALLGEDPPWRAEYAA